jgi:hypothetical protein
MEVRRECARSAPYLKTGKMRALAVTGPSLTAPHLKFPRSSNKAS